MNETLFQYMTRVLDPERHTAGDALDVMENYSHDFQATQANDWAIAGLECKCDEDYRCDNHDRDAEHDYWAGFFGKAIVQPKDDAPRGAKAFDVNEVDL